MICLWLFQACTSQTRLLSWLYLPTGVHRPEIKASFYQDLLSGIKGGSLMACYNAGAQVWNRVLHLNGVPDIPPQVRLETVTIGGHCSSGVGCPQSWSSKESGIFVPRPMSKEPRLQSGSAAVFSGRLWEAQVSSSLLDLAGPVVDSGSMQVGLDSWLGRRKQVLKGLFVRWRLQIHRHDPERSLISKISR